MTGQELAEAIAKALGTSLRHYMATTQAEAIKAAEEALAACREDCAKVCEEQQAVFLSPEYAVGQPMSSFGERFACGRCAEEIRARTTP